MALKADDKEVACETITKRTESEEADPNVFHKIKASIWSLRCIPGGERERAHNGMAVEQR
jgi:hypothetical protein